ncbi:helix-turn-helix transcriptional regulator [Vagococcus fluvialis]|uniref:helix-turn-helix transcriptional regulator n=1 Tax=Vagococcus fluvialis TaxID=2738 RepID=UPI0037BB8EFE
MNRLSESLKTTKEIADLIGVSKSTVYRFIKSNAIHESRRTGSTLLYDESVQKLIQQHFDESNESQIDSQRISGESVDLVNKELVDVLKNQIDLQVEQLNIKDTQIAELQKSNDQLQQLFLLEQQKNTKLLEENIENKRWWQWWK